MKKFFWAALAALFLVNTVFGESWQEVLSIAAQNSNDIKGARKQLEASRWTNLKSYSNFLPQVSGSLSSGDSTGYFTGFDSYAYGLSVSQHIFNGLSDYNNLRSSTVSYNNSRANLTNKEAEAFYNVRLAFLDLNLARQNLELRKKIQQSREENLRMITLFYGNGKENKGNYLRTRAQAADAKYNVVAAKRALELAKLKLSQLIDSEVKAADGITGVASQEAPNILLLTESSPAFYLAKGQLELVEISQNETLSEFLPSISLSASYRKSGSTWPPDSSNKSLSLNLSYPFFPGGANIADRAAAGNLLDKAREDFSKSRKDIYYSIQEAYENFKNTIDAYNVQQAFFNASKEQSKIYQVKYLNGLTTYYEWDQVETEYINSQINILRSFRTMLAAEASWYKSYGGYVK